MHICIICNKEVRSGPQGPRGVPKQKQAEAWSSGIMPPPLLVSTAYNNFTTSSMSGRLSGFASQHFRIMLASAVGQHLGISGLKFCHSSSRNFLH